MEENRTGEDRLEEREDQNSLEIESQESAEVLSPEERQLALEEQQFQDELAELMKEDTSGKKKKGKGKKKKAREKGEKKPRKPWSRKRKILTGAGAAAAVLLCVKLFGGKDDNMVAVNTMPLTKGTIQQELTISGPVSGTDSVDVVSSLHAEVTDIQVKEGDHVEKGQLLAVIDDSDVKKELDMAQNAYDLAVSTDRKSVV